MEREREKASFNLYLKGQRDKLVSLEICLGVPSLWRQGMNIHEGY